MGMEMVVLCGKMFSSFDGDEMSDASDKTKTYMTVYPLSIL